MGLHAGEMELSVKSVKEDSGTAARTVTTTRASSAARTSGASRTAHGAPETCASPAASASTRISACSSAAPARSGSPSAREPSSTARTCQSRRSSRSWSTSARGAACGRPGGCCASRRTRSSATPAGPATHAGRLHEELVAFSPSDPRGADGREVVVRRQEGGELRRGRPGDHPRGLLGPRGVRPGAPAGARRRDRQTQRDARSWQLLRTGEDATAGPGAPAGHQRRVYAVRDAAAARLAKAQVPRTGRAMHAARADVQPALARRNAPTRR